MSSSNCCFLTCIEVSQKAGQVVWYFHLFQNFPQFIVIHTVKGFGIVNKAEIDVFLELSCFFDDPVDVGNLVSGSSAFSKTSLYQWHLYIFLLLISALFFSLKKIPFNVSCKASLVIMILFSFYLSGKLYCSVINLCPILYDPMDWSTLGFPVLPWPSLTGKFYLSFDSEWLLCWVEYFWLKSFSLTLNISYYSFLFCKVSA